LYFTVKYIFYQSSLLSSIEIISISVHVSGNYLQKANDFRFSIANRRYRGGSIKPLYQISFSPFVFHFHLTAINYLPNSSALTLAASPETYLHKCVYLNLYLNLNLRTSPAQWTSRICARHNFFCCSSFFVAVF